MHCLSTEKMKVQGPLIISRGRIPENHHILICKAVNALNKYRVWWRRSREQYDRIKVVG
jgi:hypothetical protein